MTYAEWRTLVKTAYQGGEPTTSALMRAVTNGARSITVRDVESDLALARSYENSFRSDKVKLAGTRITDSIADVIVTVRGLMPIDDDTEAITAIIENAITAAYDDVNGIADKFDAYLLQAAIDLQRHVPFYHARLVTTFLADTAGVTTEGFVSKVALPEGARVQQLWYGHYYAALEADTEYAAGDIAVSNGRAYKVVTGGTLTSYDVATGLTSTTGDDETLGDLVFKYYTPEREWPVRNFPWYRRNQLFAGDAAMGPAYAMPEEATELWLYPALDDDHYFNLEYSGIAEDYEDTDEVTFDRTAAEAAAHYIRALLYQTELDDAKQAATSLALYQRAVRKAIVDNQQRETGSQASVAAYDYRRRWRFCGSCGSTSSSSSSDVNPNNYLARALVSPAELSLYSTAANMLTDLTVTGAAGDSTLILETSGHSYTLRAGDVMRVRCTLPATAGIAIEFTNATAFGDSLLPALTFTGQTFTTDGVATSAIFEFVFNGTAWEYVSSAIPA